MKFLPVVLFLFAAFACHKKIREPEIVSEPSAMTAAAQLSASATVTNRCLESVTVNFPQSINVATLYGKVTLEAQSGSKRALIPSRYDAGLNSFVFTPGASPLCDDFRNFSTLKVAGGVVTPTNRELRGDVTWSLSLKTSGNGPLTKTKEATWSARTESDSCSGDKCLTVTRAAVAAAIVALRQWERAEAANPVYKTTGITLLPIDGTILTPYKDVNRKNHYGNADVIFALRRGAKFISLLFPQATRVRVADLSAADGYTPYVLLGDGKKLYTHPEGSHAKGQDVDVSYFYKDATEKTLDWEKNFWFMYALLDGTGVDMLITAFREELRGMAGFAYGSGYINELAYARFNKLMNDTSLNHDKHLHLSIRNADNKYKSILFNPADSAFNCYLSLRPQYRGGEANFCL